MDLLEAKKLIYRGENGLVEFKRKINHPEKVVREVVAFANTNGGHLFVGVDDDRTIVGCKFAEEEDFILQKAIKELCRPAIDYKVHLFPLSEKRALLHYEIFPGKRKPYFAFEQKHHRYGKAYVRVEDRSIQASAELRHILKHERDPKDTHFSYGNNEKLLFNFLHTNDKVTLSQFREISGLDYRSASTTLVQMVQANVLKLIPREQEDWFVAVEG